MEPMIIFRKAARIPKNVSRTRRNTILLVVFLALLMLLVSAILWKLFIHHDQDPTITISPIPSQPSIINETCINTLYPSLCFTTISSVTTSKRLSTPQEILEVSINTTVRTVKNSQSKITNLFSHQDLSSQEKNALDDCMEMLEQTLYELRLAVKELRNFSQSRDTVHHFYSDLKTLLSAAMTNENTCIEGISDVEEIDPKNQKGLKLLLQDLLNPVSRMISNSLAMAKQMEEINSQEEEEGVNVQKLKFKKYPLDEFPFWMPRSDKKLMEMATKIRPNVVVAGDGSGNYRTISEAIKMAPNMSINRYVIKIKAGVYEENVEILREKTNIMLVGAGMNCTVISSHRNFLDGFSTFNSATLTVIGSRFIARDLTIINSSGSEKHQAVALRVTSDSAFYRCNFISYQDTLYAHSLRQFYRECTIQGTIDFIFGNAAALFQNCLILVRKPNPRQKNMITAQGREDPNQNTGISLQNCTILAAPDLITAGTSKFSTFLGRPWRNYSRTIVMKSYLGDLIHPAGWYQWNQYSRLDAVDYIEYKNIGPGSDTRRRVTWRGYKKNCSKETAELFTVRKFLNGADDWIESIGFPLFYGY